jgi:hypothetical protein
MNFARNAKSSHRKETAMSDELRMSYDEAKYREKKFYEAEEALEESFEGFPESVDGGEGTEYIVAMICKIAEDAGDVANVSGVGGRKLNDATNALEGVDEGVAQTFRDLVKESMQ